MPTAWAPCPAKMAAMLLMMGISVGSLENGSGVKNTSIIAHPETFENAKMPIFQKNYLFL
jgi:hypothetical protein